MTELEVVRAARALIATQSTWTQHTSARDRRGEVADPSAPSACRWCAFGALLRSKFGDPQETSFSFTSMMLGLDARAKALGYVGLVHANDGKDGHRAVLSIFDARIRELEAA